MNRPNIEKLEWDSQNFGYSIGKITLSDEQSDFLPEILDESYKQKMKLLYIFTDHSSFIKKELSKRNAILVDEKTTFIRKTKNYEKMDEAETVSLIKKELTKDILSLAYQAGEYSRFKIDINFKNEEFEKLYKIWIERSLDKAIAFEVLGIEKDNKIIGLLTLGEKKSRADIGLVAVDENERGKGHGKVLMNRAIELSKKRGYDEIQVVTQLKNTIACEYYKKSGFSIETIQDIYHIWL